MVGAVLDEVVAALAHGIRVELRGFGTFAVKVIGRNPKTGATVHVPEKKIPVFRQGYEIRKRLNPLATTPISPEQTSSV
jgi:integration host factor subunit beta